LFLTLDYQDMCHQKIVWLLVLPRGFHIVTRRKEKTGKGKHHWKTRLNKRREGQQGKKLQEMRGRRGGGGTRVRKKRRRR